MNSTGWGFGLMCLQVGEFIDIFPLKYLLPHPHILPRSRWWRRLWLPRQQHPKLHLPHPLWPPPPLPFRPIPDFNLPIHLPKHPLHHAQNVPLPIMKQHVVLRRLDIRVVQARLRALYVQVYKRICDSDRRRQGGADVFLVEGEEGFERPWAGAGYGAGVDKDETHAAYYCLGFSVF